MIEMATPAGRVLATVQVSGFRGVENRSTRLRAKEAVSGFFSQIGCKL